MWRPPDWEETRPKRYFEGVSREAGFVIESNHFKLGVEAGADAMLEAIPRLKLENIYNTLVVDVLASAMIEHNVKAGYFAFIPSEEDKDD